MKERPIIFSAPMVRSILEGRKTQTRRIVKNIGIALGIGPILKGSDDVKEWTQYCPYGKPGDRLWVRETWSKAKQPYLSTHIFYRADGESNGKQNALSFVERDSKWRSPIHMPRWASRILLEVTNVRVDRLNDISEEDAIAEGGVFTDNGLDQWGQNMAGWSHKGVTNPDGCLLSARSSFGNLWESINGHGSWDLNPFVWVIVFKEIK